MTLRKRNLSISISSNKFCYRSTLLTILRIKLTAFHNTFSKWVSMPPEPKLKIKKTIPTKKMKKRITPIQFKTPHELHYTHFVREIEFQSHTGIIITAIENCSGMKKTVKYVKKHPKNTVRMLDFE